MRLSNVRVTTGQVMTLVALAALNLAVTRAASWDLVSSPSLWIFLGAIDFLILWKLILRRSLQAFHYTFLIVSVVAYCVMVNLIEAGRFKLLSPLVRWYQQLAGWRLSGNFREFVEIGELWMACLLSLSLGCILGWLVAWLERRRGWDIAAFFRGAIVGLVIANLLSIIDGAVWGWMVESRSRLACRLVLLGVCLILGGLMGLSRLKSNAPGGEGRGSEGEASFAQRSFSGRKR